MDRAFALVVAAGVAALAALIMGEYEPTLGTAAAMGVVLGLGLPEVVLGIARWRGTVPAGITAACAGGAVLWAGWIASGRGVAPLRSTVWIGVALGVVLAAWRLRPARA